MISPTTCRRCGKWFCAEKEELVCGIYGECPDCIGERRAGNPDLPLRSYSRRTPRLFRREGRQC
jgi:hypothetical protein